MNLDRAIIFLDGLQRDRRSCYEDDEGNSAALPDGALELLGDAVRACDLQRVFEFGSGRSTSFFLRTGCHVSSVEDSQSWTSETLTHVDVEQKANLDLRWQPLQRVWMRGVPYMAWKLPAELAASLNKADLVLIDSPLFTGFRECVLFHVLSRAERQLVVLDDLRIPAVEGFCRQLASANPGLIYRSVPIGHGMGFFLRTEKSAPLRFPFRLTWWARAWRRYLIWLLSWRRHHQHA